MGSSLHNKKIKRMVICALCCAITCVCAMYTIHIGPVPITLANFAVYVSGAILGAFYGAVSQILYLLLVFVGCPFTSKLQGGPSYLIGPTAGYMYGYVLIALIVGYLYKTFGKKYEKYEKRMLWFLIGAILGTFVCYAMGTVWFVATNNKNLDFSASLKICVYPFLIGDFIKILVSTMIIPKVEKALDV